MNTKENKFNELIPELRVSNLAKSKEFYVDLLGFKIEYQRDDFIMLRLNNSQIMIQQLTLPSNKGSWNVSEEMNYPFGRGINFQIIVLDILLIYNLLKANNYKIFIDLIDNYYKADDITYHVREFLVQDPDGYLLRFQQDILD